MFALYRGGTVHSFHELVLSDSLADFVIPIIYYLIYVFFYIQYSIIHNNILIVCFVLSWSTRFTINKSVLCIDL